MFTSTSTTTPNEYSILELPPNPIRPPFVMERAMVTTTTKWRYYNNNGNNGQVAPNCPRCASSNTKFCYYNNYSLSQPRYFCKGCRRYWTKGGSLRNVPVGGGCRKSRRARATRQGGGSSYPGPALGQSSVGSGTEKATDIDLAAVFAKYVNQDDGGNEESSSPGAASFTSSDILQASSLDTDSQAEDIAMFEYQEPLDLVNGGGDPDQLQQAVMPNNQLTMHGDINCQDFVYQDSSSAFELHDILGDQLEADILWPEGSNLPNFEPQQAAVQLQDFGLFSADDDPLRVPANLVNDHWGSFDLSAYEIFSRP